MAADIAQSTEEIFAICKGNATSAVERIQPLLEQHPEIAKAKDLYNRLPLHYALQTSAPPHVIHCLIETWPDAMKIPDERGWYPLLLACMNETSVDVVRALLNLWPDVVKIRTAGKYPLHHACFCGKRTQSIEALMNCWPESVRARTSVNVDDDDVVEDEIPLHAACSSWRRHSIRLDTVRLLVRAWPDSIFVKDRTGSMPLENACASPYETRRPCLDVVKCLIGNHPSVLHFICAHSKYAVFKHVIPLLRKSAEESQVMRRLDGVLPLHVLCQRRRADLEDVGDVESIKEVMFMLSDAVGVAARPTGDLPLHCLCKSFAHFDLVEYLVSKYADALKTPNRQGFLPLFCACSNDAAGLDVLYFLLRQSPESILLKS